MNTSLTNYEAEEILERARDGVKQRFYKVLNNIRSAPLAEAGVIHKILRNVTLEEACQALADYQQLNND